MKYKVYLFVLLCMIYSQSIVSQSNRSSSQITAAQNKIVYNGTFSDDLFANMGLLGALIGKDESPNPFIRFKNQEVTLYLAFLSNSTPSLTIARGEKSEFSLTFKTPLIWTESDKRLTAEGDRYVLIVETQGDIRIGLMEIENKRPKHRWDIKPNNKNYSWLSNVLMNAHLGMAKLKAVEDSYSKDKTKKWTPILASFEKNFPKVKASYTTQSKEERINKQLKEGYFDAETLRDLADNADLEGMLLLGDAYHDGNILGIEKNDFLSYYWLMRTYLSLNEDVCDSLLNHIFELHAPKNLLNNVADKSNYYKLRNHEAYIPAENDYLDTNILEPIQLSLHPLGFLPTQMGLKSTSTIKKECLKYKGWESYKTGGYLSFYSGQNEYPSLYGKNIESLTYSHFGASDIYSFGYILCFSTYSEAVQFLFRYAYDLLNRGVLFSKLIDSNTAKGEKDMISLVAKFYTYNGKKRIQIQNKLYYYPYNEKYKGEYSIGIKFDYFK